MVWEDKRGGNFETYYASLTPDSVIDEIRITRTRAESSYPCVACDGSNVYILWQEFTGKVFDLYYARLVDGEIAVRKRVLSTNLDSSCPVAAVGIDGNLHIAWHEGPFKQTAVYYGKIAGDSLVERQVVCEVHPEAFRPDIACNENGEILLAWFEGLEIKSRLWDCEAWGEEILVATNEARSWRLSVAGIGEAGWALAWFDNTAEGSDVYVKFFDGKEWHDQVTVSKAFLAYYPSVTALGEGELAVIWEEKDPPTDNHLIMLSCYRNGDFSEPMALYRNRAAGRYPSLATHKGDLHAVWFSGMHGNDEIFHGLLRRE
jgi:hypothetical protein